MQGSEKSQESTAEMLQRTLHISAALAERLVDGGISSLDEVAYIPFGELRKIGGLWDEETTALRTKARNHLLHEALRTEWKIMNEPPQYRLGGEKPEDY